MNTIDKELKFFLPTIDGLCNEWGFEDNPEQLLYAECCKYGADKIAQAMRRNIHSFIKELYDIAADTRFRTAQLMRKPADEYSYYGVYYFPFNSKSLVIDPVEKNADRWGEYFDSILTKFNDLCELALHDENFGVDHYGEGFYAKSDSEGISRSFSLRYQVNNSEDYLVSKITRVSDKYITIKHVPASYLGKIFSLAQKTLDQIKKTPISNKHDVLKNILRVRQLLFHSTPLVKGSQTATQIVIAGIMKYKGIELTPFIPTYDHFLDAEVFTHKEYIEKGLGHFISEPQFIKREQSEVDEDFFVKKFRASGKELAEPYSGMASLEEKMENFLIKSLYRIKELHGIDKFEISEVGLEYKIGMVKKIKIKCTKKIQENIANRACDFFGIQTILERIGEEKLLYKSGYPVSGLHLKPSSLNDIG